MTLRVVLVGLPGVGKTTVGAALAIALGVPFRDLDELVAAAEGETPAEVLRTRGEDALRDAESRALAPALRSSGVVATGGGTVESADARALLSAEPLVVWLTAPDAALLGRLDGGDRPLVEGPTAERLADLIARRAPWYEEVADVTVDASGPVSGIVAELARLVVPA